LETAPTSDLERVGQYFSRSATAFDALYSEDQVHPLMRFVNKKFRSDIYERFMLSLTHVQRHRLHSALDVGCGSGRYAYALARLKLSRIVGIDVSQRMIDLAIETTTEVHGDHTALEFVCCDFDTFRTYERFDVVLAMGFFDYVKDPRPVLRKMRELATHSVIASFPSISFYRTPIRKVRYYLKNCPVYFYRASDIPLIAREAGFSACEVKKIKGAGMDYFVTLFP
jgi:2-polyprenyl-3-methyl-5-hydroxy-6-metoxy-1,4-benzoquinol methylase